LLPTRDNDKKANLVRLQRLLKDKGVQFEGGVTDDEIVQIETKFIIKFPTDLRQFLQLGLPISESFVDWRKGLISKDAEAKIVSRLDWPLEGMLFDLQSNDFWINSWGDRPETYKEKEQIAREKYLTFPKLIPIYSHRYIPMEQMESGNPIFSVHQMDIIYYGYDLATYLANEFHFELPYGFEIVDEPKNIRFWSNWIDKWTEN
jgi:hypothetical protein